jgi:hypothetical protein
VAWPSTNITSGEMRRGGGGGVVGRWRCRVSPTRSPGGATRRDFFPRVFFVARLSTSLALIHKNCRDHPLLWGARLPMDKKRDDDDWLSVLQNHGG